VPEEETPADFPRRSPQAQPRVRRLPYCMAWWCSRQVTMRRAYVRWVSRNRSYEKDGHRGRPFSLPTSGRRPSARCRQARANRGDRY
jgi:hypothetical protein